MKATITIEEIELEIEFDYQPEEKKSDIILTGRGILVVRKVLK
jgi:hypothetical protein